MRAVVADTLMTRRPASPPRSRATRSPPSPDRDRVRPLTIIPVAGHRPRSGPATSSRALIADAAAAQDTPLARRRLPRRHPEDRVEGRGPARAARPRRPRRAPRARRVGVGAHRAPARRPHHQRDARTASCARTRASTCRTSTRAGPRCCPSTPTARPSRIRDALRGHARRRGRGHHLRHVRPAVAPGPHRRRDRRGRASPRSSTCAARPTRSGRELQVTEVAVADEIASAAELVMGKAAGVPVAIVRGLDPTWFREGSRRASSIRAARPRTSFR